MTKWLGRFAIYIYNLFYYLIYNYWVLWINKMWFIFPIRNRFSNNISIYIYIVIRLLMVIVHFIIYFNKKYIYLSISIHCIFCTRISFAVDNSCFYDCFMWALIPHYLYECLCSYLFLCIYYASVCATVNSILIINDTHWKTKYVIF